MAAANVEIENLDYPQDSGLGVVDTVPEKSPIGNGTAEVGGSSSLAEKTTRRPSDSGPESQLTQRKSPSKEVKGDRVAEIGGCSASSEAGSAATVVNTLKDEMRDIKRTIFTTTATVENDIGESSDTYRTTIVNNVAGQIDTIKRKMENSLMMADESDAPMNCDVVEENLYLGSLAAACDVNMLKKYKISYILTIDSCPLPLNVQELPQVTTKFVRVSDMPREDILQYFDECNDFISLALDHRKRILVHCYYGVSRSATLVLAYLMKKHRISLEEAQTRLTQRRSSVGPNYGFLSQLKLYEIMEYKIEKTNLFYKRFRLHVASRHVKAVKVLSTPYRDVIKSDPAILRVSPEPVVYRCRKCRRTLTCASNILPHTESKSPLWFDLPKPYFNKETVQAGAGGEDENNEGSEGSSDQIPTTSTVPPKPSYFLPPPICNQMLFTEPLAWMTEVAHTLQGKLHCPNVNCKSKLGSFNWVMGCLCPCGAKVQPAFYLVPSKVDRSTSVQNVQVTI